MKKLFSGLLVSSVIFSLFACSGPATKDLEDPTGRRGWITRGGRIYKDETTQSIIIEGVGAAQSIKNIQLRRETAESRARADIATRLQSVITRMREDYMQSISDLSDSSTEEQLVRVTGKELTVQTLSGVQIIDRYYDEKNDVFYVYAKLDLGTAELANKFKSAVSPVVAKRIKNNSEEALKKLDQSVENYLQNSIPTATEDK